MEPIVEKRYQRLEQRRDFLGAINWRPEDTDDAIECFDFQDYISSLVRLWDSMCRFNDFLLDHDMDCPNDHSEEFKFANGNFKFFVEIVTPLVDLTLPSFESKFGDIDNASELRSSLQEAEALAKSYVESELAPLRTPISEWE